MITKIRGQHFDLLPERVAVWQEKKILLCSDLHWGREAFLQKYGLAIPDQSFTQESPILARAIAENQIQEWWILGDFIHHPQGMHQQLLQNISQWMRSLAIPIKLIPGNHDRLLAQWAGELEFEVKHQGIDVDGFRFRHDAGASPENFFSWYGHLHPSISVGNLFRTGKLPCFWIRENHAFLPAFSRLAGGAEISGLADDDQIFAIANEEIIQLK
jgi:DNA ligase-associated metallophosphoesterase